MLLNITLAKQIADKTSQVLRRDIFITDLSGQLIAGTNENKPFISAALNAAQTGHAVVSEIGEHQIKWFPFVYEEQTIAIFGLPLDNGPITQEAITLLQGLAEVIVYQHSLLDRIQSAERIRADFIRHALTSSDVDHNDIYSQADILQVHLRSPQAVIIAKVCGLESATREKHRRLSSEEQQLRLDDATKSACLHIKKHLNKSQDTLIAYIGNDTFILLCPIAGESITTLNSIRFMTDRATDVLAILQHISIGEEITIGIGQFYPELSGLRKSYQDAKLALEVGSKVWGSGRAYHIKQVGMFITLANTSQDRKAELAHQILSPLLKDEQLFRTVQTFLASGLNLTAAAEKLHVHRNTLIYRLDKTRKLIELDPRHFDDALQIKLGLMFYQDTKIPN
jgi:carbohydrate diacid regulator